MIKAGRILASTIAISTSLLVLIGFFIPALNSLSYFIISWGGIVLAFTLLLGVVNLLRVHLSKIQQSQGSQRIYSAVLIASLAFTLILGRDGPASINGQAIFKYVLLPLESTLFALMAFFVLSATYRAFRIKNLETFFFVVFASIVLLGQVPAGYQLWPEFPLIKDWVLRFPALAGTRGILIGVALGTIATGLRIVLGLDRPYADADI